MRQSAPARLKVQVSVHAIEARVGVIGFFLLDCGSGRACCCADQGVAGGSASPSSDSTSKRHADLVPAMEEDVEPAVPSEDSIDRSASLSDDLSAKQDEGVDERLDLARC